MPEQIIPVKDYEKKKKEIEEDGLREVVSFEPLENRPGWGKLTWRYKIKQN